MLIAVVISMLFIGFIALIWLDICHSSRIHESAREKVIAAADRHIDTLVRKRLPLIRMNAYAVADSKAWSKEINYFFTNVIEPALTEAEKYMLRSPITSPQPAVISPIAAKLIEELVRERSIKLEEPGEYDPSMSPTEHEAFCARMLDRAGWSTQVTQASDDQGADVIARKDEFSVVIQCKQYREVSGMRPSKRHSLPSSTTNATLPQLSSPALSRGPRSQLATSTGVLLLHHDDSGT